MMKLIFILVVTAVYVQCSSNRLRDILLDEIIDRYEMKKETIVKANAEAWADPKFCTDAGLECSECSACHDNLQYGQCIKGATKAKCLCNWGWTGQNAERVPDYEGGSSRFGINRIRADDCKTPCHYEPNRWNSACAPGPVRTTPSFPNCEEAECKKKIPGICINDKCTCHQPYCAATGVAKKCMDNECKCDQQKCAEKYGTCVKNECKCHQATCAEAGGECDEGVCKKRCCKNLMESMPLFTGSNFNGYCKERCHYQDVNTPCPTPPTPSPICNPKCVETGGLPDEATGYCQCCKDFTGPSAFYKGGKLYADYCDVYCSHEMKGGASNMLCVNQDYVRRARAVQKSS